MGDRPALDIGVGTAAWGSYGQYLSAWADSLIAQNVKPSQAAIVDAGCDDTEAATLAAQKLTEAGIPCSTATITHETVGGSKNKAISLLSTEWAMLLDADDQLFPYALSEVADLSERADVVSLGAIHKGTLRIFPNVSANWILRGKLGCFSCAAFKRNLWVQRPWHEHNDFVDSTFWVGFAHLGAQFAAAPRPGFMYVSHGDSMSHTLTPAERNLAMAQYRKACREWTL